MIILMELIFKLKMMQDAISKAKEHGAIIVRDKMEFNNFYLAYLVDPTGLGLGLTQKK